MFPQCLRFTHYQQLNSSLKHTKTTKHNINTMSSLKNNMKKATTSDQGSSAPNDLDRMESAMEQEAHGFSLAEQKRIMRRVDIRLVATVGLLYCFSVIDRSNLPSAAVTGMREDLDLTGNRYVSSNLWQNPLFLDEMRNLR